MGDSNFISARYSLAKYFGKQSDKKYSDGELLREKSKFRFCKASINTRSEGLEKDGVITLMLHSPSIDELNGEKDMVVNLEKSFSKEFKKYINLDKFILDKVRNNQELFKDNVHYLSAGHRLVGK